MPSTLAQLCAYALQYERNTAAHYEQYERLLRAWGATTIADALEELGKQQQRELRALETGAGKPNRSDGQSWVHGQERDFSPEGLDAGQPAVPRDVRRALHVLSTAEGRAGASYADVAEHARDSILRNCASEMAEHKRKRQQLLESLGSCEARAGSVWFDWTENRAR